MAVMMPRQNWTDERLDHFEKRVDERFDRVDERFDRVDEQFKHVNRQFEHVDKQFNQVDKQFKQVDQRLDADIRELRQAVTRMNENMNRNFIALAMLIVAAVVFF